MAIKWVPNFLAGILSIDKKSLFWRRKQANLFLPLTYQFWLERQSWSQERGRSKYFLVDKKIFKIFIPEQPVAALKNQYQCEMKGTSGGKM